MSKSQGIKTCFRKSYRPNWTEEVFAIKNFTDKRPWTHVINTIMVERLFAYFMNKNCKKQINLSLELKK